jgi:signal transduction histidine kinase
MTSRLLKKYIFLIAAVTSLIVFAAYYYRTYSTNFQPSVERFNKKFLDKERRLDQVLGASADRLKYKKVSEQWGEFEAPGDVNIHVYRNDSLKFWNTNQLPIIRFAEIHYPAEGVLHLQNGWYYAKIKEVNDYLVCASFLIKHDFAYENKDLINEYAKGLSVPFESAIGIGEESGLSVSNGDGEYIFSIIPNEEQTISHRESVTLLLLLLFSISLWLIQLSKLREMYKAWGWLIPVGVVALRVASIYFGWFSFMNDNEALNPGLFGSNAVFPNFLEYLVNVVVLVYVLMEIRGIVLKSKPKAYNKYIGYGLYIVSFLFWYLILSLAEGLIENSTISLIVNELFTLNIYSVLAIASLGVLFYHYFQFILQLIRYGIKNGIQITHLSVLTFIICCCYFYYEVNFGYEILLPAVFPAMMYGIGLYLASKERTKGQLATGLIMLFLFSAVISVSFDKLIERKERSERELYADQLATEKSLVTEVEYSVMADEIEEDNFLKRFVGNPFDISVSDFQENLERRFFNGFWERYEMSFNLFNKENLPLVDKRDSSTARFDHLEKIINISGVPSEVNPEIFFISDYKDQYSYIIRQSIEAKNGEVGTLYCTLKSKKIPEEIGFPRLLISSEANVLESLESYSIARYRQGSLLTKYGDFNYPSTYSIMTAMDNSGGFFNYGGFEHFLMRKSKNNVVILSKKNKSTLDLITSFSYLFSFYGLLLLPLLFRGNKSKSYRRTLSLAMKIQVVLISLVFLSLLAFGWGSGVFVSNQYNEFTNDVIREKLNSVETEVKAKLGDFDELSIDENGDYMQYILQKFARVFFTDINLYDADGYLLATSRPKVFNVGLISEQMNPNAFKNLKFGQRSEFVHQESIGKLKYSSAYQPFYNRAGKKLAFINLQHFGQQREFENQIEKFLVAIINVFILLLAVSIILAILISNWLTSPLRILQENFAHVRFGKHNERISYDKEDEIGALVREYNQKLDELEYTASQLAKSERESAWREMAKQVAHEIKNPLTPMKLSVQQLLRSFDPDDPKSQEKLQRVANSIVEQIDSLTNIANEFSNFAKMPNPTEQEVNIVSLITGIVEMFDHNDKDEVKVSCENKEILVLADKDQILRVFNNLLKNAIQSIPRDQEGHIEIRIKTVDGTVVIEVEDDGSGIEQDQYSRIFVPYFTTKSTGTGLGLAMVKQIIENHQGTIDFKSRVGKGTTFKVTLPVKA